MVTKKKQALLLALPVWKQGFCSLGIFDGRIPFFLGPLHPSMPTQCIGPDGQHRKGLSDPTQVVHAANDRDPRSNLDALEKKSSEISRHPHASVGRGIS
jgi:hypothetical protein